MKEVNEVNEVKEVKGRVRADAALPPTPSVDRRRFLLGVLAVAVAGPAAARYPVVVPGRVLKFPADHGSHPDYRTEWWYITGWVTDGDGHDFGVQVTFFRNRPEVQENNPSAFAPKQLLFAHAALSDPAYGRLRHDQRSARAGFGLAEAARGNTRVQIEDWSLDLTRPGYRARIAARDFTLDLRFVPTQPVLPEGAAGFSRKGPRPGQASYYYSWPHLAVSGTVSEEGRALEVTGQAWLDHEWSSEYLAKEAAGWDWVGLNFAGGGALMAFRIRGKDGEDVWAGATWRSPDGQARSFPPGEVEFQPLRRWRSPHTAVEYPIAMRLTAGDLVVDLEPLMDDQEMDARGSTGTVYWEGAVRVKSDAKEIGRGYLELTGYWSPLKL